MNTTAQMPSQTPTPIVFRPWHNVAPVRRRALIWPREHGAWGILLVALITGAAVGLSSVSNLLPLLWLTLAAIAAFCLRTPIENSMPRSPFRPRTHAEWQWVSTAAAVYILIGALAGVMLWLDGALRLLWLPSLAALALFAWQAVVKRFGRAWRLPAELAAAFGMTLAAAAGYSLAAGKADRLAIGIWLLNGLFAANQILYVQYRIREAHETHAPSSLRRKQIFLASELLTVLAILAAAQAQWLPALALVAFVPLLIRGTGWYLRNEPTPLRIHRLGKIELAHAIAFGLLLITLTRVF